VGATRADNIPGRRTDTDNRAVIIPARGPIRTTLNA